MAERRMFAKSIVLSDVFLDMPMSARCLYFTLGMLADDDGFVGSPRSIMRQCGASTDDLQILLAKRYVLGFESGVIVIKHWRINNFLRADRHHKTTYVEELDTLCLDEKEAYTEVVKQGVLPLGQPNDNQVVGKLDTEDRLGKDRLGKVNILPPTPSSTEPDTENTYPVTVDRTTAAYNGVTAHDVLSEWVSKFNSIAGLQKVKKTTINDETNIQTILRHFSLEDIEQTFDKLAKSDFLQGRNNKNWKVSFDWFTDLDNFTKIFNGKYDNRETNTEKVSVKDMEAERRKREEEEEINRQNAKILARIAERERREANGNN